MERSAAQFNLSLLLAATAVVAAGIAGWLALPSMASIKDVESRFSAVAVLLVLYIELPLLFPIELAARGRVNLSTGAALLGATAVVVTKPWVPLVLGGPFLLTLLFIHSVPLLWRRVSAGFCLLATAVAWLFGFQLHLLDAFLRPAT